jgi:hypothetical protein
LSIPEQLRDVYNFDLRITRARTLLPAALAFVLFGFILDRVRFRLGGAAIPYFKMIIEDNSNMVEPPSQRGISSITQHLPLTSTLLRTLYCCPPSVARHNLGQLLVCSALAPAHLASMSYKWRRTGRWHENYEKRVTADHVNDTIRIPLFILLLNPI